MKQRVILIHGLFLKGFIMNKIANFLQKNGYEIYNFSYHSTSKSIQENAKKLNEYLIKHNNYQNHFIAHSLGGLLLRHLAYINPSLITGKCITLGSPHKGSILAHKVKRYFPFILGKSYNFALNGDVPQWSEKLPLLSIAGDKAFGIGMFVLKKPHDGTVCVKSTKLTNATHIIVHETHMSMLFSTKVFEKILYFLKFNENGKN